MKMKWIMVCTLVVLASACGKKTQETKPVRKDNQKNKILYEQGLLGLEQKLNSNTAMVNAGYNLNTTSINVQLAQANTNINNKF